MSWPPPKPKYEIGDGVFYQLPKQPKAKLGVVTGYTIHYDRGFKTYWVTQYWLDGWDSPIDERDIKARCQPETKEVD